MKNYQIEIFLSASSNPGKFGEVVHNTGFKADKLNYLYKAIKISKIKSLINTIRLYNIKGCSISMPFKVSVIKYLDKLDPIAKKVQAVNTIVNDGKKLIGFNTDIFAVNKILKHLKINKSNSVLITGSGGMARATIVALKEKNIKNIFITGRNILRVKSLARKFDLIFIEYNQRNYFEADVFINTTPVGMKLNDDKLPISKDALSNFKKVIDVVVKQKDTALIKEAKKRKLLYADGVSLTFFQAFRQYEIYTGKKAPSKIMFESYKTLLNTKRKTIFT